MVDNKLTVNNYPFLKELGIKEENDGVFFGNKWGGSGDYTTSYNPSTGEAIAKVKTATKEDYE